MDSIYPVVTEWQSSAADFSVRIDLSIELINELFS